MKVKSESEVAQSCPTLHDPMDCSLAGSSIHGICQARVLEWVAIAFSESECSVQFSRSVVSDSLRPHELQPIRLLRPWGFPGENTGVGCHQETSIQSLGQDDPLEKGMANHFRIFALRTSGQFSSVIQSCPTLCDPMDYSMPGFPVHHQLPSLLQLMSIKSVMPSNHPTLCRPLLLLPLIFPSIRVFSSESVLHVRWPSI